jgi:amino-acid N-acetyltransferase
VAEEYRSQGTGKALVEKLVAAAREAGDGELYLLTLTADRFFARLGFDRVDRAVVPDAIRGTTEFESICPVSSTCMKKEI